jgi:hypothetical protein
MSVAGFVVLAIAVWATYASVRTIRRIGLRRFGKAVGRLGWDLGKVALGGTALVGGAVASSAAGRAGDEDADSGLLGPDIWDFNDLENHSLRPESPWYSGDFFDDDKKDEV